MFGCLPLKLQMNVLYPLFLNEKGLFFFEIVKYDERRRAKYELILLNLRDCMCISLSILTSIRFFHVYIYHIRKYMCKYIEYIDILYTYIYICVCYHCFSRTIQGLVYWRVSKRTWRLRLKVYDFISLYLKIKNAQKFRKEIEENKRPWSNLCIKKSGGANTRWWFQIFFVFTPNLGEDSHFESYVSIGLVQPPPRTLLVAEKCSFWVNPKYAKNGFHFQVASFSRHLPHSTFRDRAFGWFEVGLQFKKSTSTMLSGNFFEH